MFAPQCTGSTYFNYKKTFSIVLMALVDADYKFICIDVGGYGSTCDSTVFKNSGFGRKFLSDDPSLNIPQDAALPMQSIKLPFVIVADEAFPLKRNILRPYPGKNLSDMQRHFNYRLSRARRIVECAFGNECYNIYTVDILF